MLFEPLQDADVSETEGATAFECDADFCARPRGLRRFVCPRGCWAVLRCGVRR
jgi:hypothetical protein